MATVVRYVSFLILMLFLCACNRYTERRWAHEAIATAETLMEQQPDSALYLLQSIPDTTMLSVEQQMMYRLYLLQAKDKCYWDITADTGIVLVQQYFVQRNDWPHAALAAFYWGRIRQERKDDRQAMEAYVEAEAYAAHTGDDRLKGMIQHNIGWLYYNHQQYIKAIPVIKKAIDYAQQAGVNNYKRTIGGLQLLGGAFLNSNQADSAVYYCRQALDIAVAHNDEQLQAALSHNLAVIYRKMGDMEQSKTAIERVRTFAPSGIDRPRFCVTLSKFYTGNNQFDSAAIYAHRALSLLDTVKEANLIRAEAYAALQELEHARGHYKQALEYHRQYTGQLIKVYQNDKEHSLDGLQEQYELALIKNAHQQLSIRNQQDKLTLLVLSITLILLAFAFYYHHTKKKSALLAMEQQMAQLKALAAHYDEKDKTLKNTLIRNFELVRKLSVLEATLNREEKTTGSKLLHRFKEIVFDTPDKNYWNNFYPIIDNYYNGRLHTLKNNYPLLTETEFRICCLCLADFKNEEMAVFLNLSINTILATKTGIRKKIHLEERGDIKVFLLQKIEDLHPQ